MKVILILVNALHAILQTIVMNILMEIPMENVYVKMDIIMITKIIYVRNALYFGYLFNIFNFQKTIKLNLLLYL